MAAVDRARAAAETQMEVAKALPPAYLREVFESEEARGWPMRRIGDIAHVQSGYAFRSEWYATAGVRLLRNVNVLQGFVDWSDTAFLPEPMRPAFSAYELRAGDLIMALDRPVTKAGLKLTRLADADVPALLVQRVARFLPLSGTDDSYLWFALQSRRFLNAITAHEQSLAVPHILSGQVAAVQIPLPDLVSQRGLAAKLALRMAAADPARAAAEAQLAGVGHLPSAILRRAFQGEL